MSANVLKQLLFIMTQHCCWINRIIRSSTLPIYVWSLDHPGVRKFKTYSRYLNREFTSDNLIPYKLVSNI